MPKRSSRIPARSEPRGSVLARSVPRGTSVETEQSKTLERLEAAELELAAIRSQLEHQARLVTLGTIAGLIAHEFNNILTPIHSYAQMALDAREDQELTGKALRRSLEGSERAAQIASAILDLVRDTDQSLLAPTSTQQGGSTRNNANLAGDVELEHPSTLVAQGVKTALACLARDPAQHGIRLTLDVSETLAARVRPVVLQHVILNLLLNAFRAVGVKASLTSSDLSETEQSTGAERVSRKRMDRSITIAARSVSRAPTLSDREIDSRASQQETWEMPGLQTKRANSGWVILSIQDSGVGMSPEQLQTLFTPFVSGHTQSTTKGSRGTGLGMTMTKRLVEAAGGWLTAKSALGAGTTIQIVLPEA